MSTKTVRFLDASQSLINHAVVPKSRKPKFELLLKILDLNNVPLVTGASYVKWHLPSSAAAEHRGKTSRAPIKEHKVTWNYEKTITLRITADKNGLLQNTEIHFEVMQEYHSGPKAERINLGIINLNLAEYVDDTGEKEEEIMRRYLMQESKINSTIKISIWMKLIEGEKNFTAPPLRTGPIFGGIAGIMNQEQADADDIGHLPTMPNKLSRDAGEQQEMYRKTLAAAWSSHELPADECIENIFAGGDGWGNLSEDTLLTPESSTTGENASIDSERLQVPFSAKLKRDNQRDHLHSKHDGTRNLGRQKSNSNDSSSGQVTPEPTPSNSSDDRTKRFRKRQNEISEFDVREDLRSWEISVPAK